MKSKSLLVILPAVMVFSQRFILVSQQRLNLTIREMPVTASLASGGSLFWWGLANNRSGQLSQIDPALLGISTSVQAVLLRHPLPPQLHLGIPACSSVLSHTAPGPLGSLPFVPLNSQVSTVIHFFVPSFIYFT